METKTLLLNQAEAFVRQRGFDGVSFADLADSQGIRKASVHYHFPAKGDLSLALITRYRATFQDRLHAITASHDTGGARLLQFIDLYRDAADGGRSLCLCVALSVTQTALPQDTMAELSTFHRDVSAWLETVFRQGQADGSIQHGTDPKAEAHAALAQMEGAQIVARAAQDIARFEAAISTLRARAL